MRLLLISLFMSAALVLSAQQHEHHHHHDEDHSHHDHMHHEGHDHHENEIGLAVAPVYFTKEKSVALGMHLHYLRTIHHSKWGLGLGFEKIFDEHAHNIAGIIISYRPIHPLSFSISPGINVDNRFKNPEFAIHGEIAYEFEFGNFHLGPVLDLARDHEEIHISLGVHFGYGF
ncbi:MAG: hypothetical protein LC107_10620 [Chitinophagales bacterium]|nr:hypothetical protein [Chitinophagales bacterium]